MKAYLVAGLGFGDEGKGSIVDFLARTLSARMVVRYNGGAQAAHNVVDPDGRHHTFSQFGSGTFAGADTLLSRYMLVNPIAMQSEARHLEELGLKDVFSRMHVEEQALVTTPYHVALNRLKELERDQSRHGSCGMGIGETVAYAQEHPEDTIRVADLKAPDLLREKLSIVQARLLRKACGLTTAHDPLEWDILEDPAKTTLETCMLTYQTFAEQVDIVDSSFLHSLEGNVIFEGAQGVLLDQAWGTFPHVTRSDTTFRNARILLGGHQMTRIGVLRSYFTRHGAGPFPTCDYEMFFPDHNTTGPWQGNFRWGHFDLPAARWAMNVIGGVDHLAFTCLDHVETPKVCAEYRDFHWPLHMLTNYISPQHGEHLKWMAGEASRYRYAQPIYQEMSVQSIAKHLGAPASILSRGPTAKDKTW